ncbi:MAG: YbjQ family protein [Fibrobacterales bacterium]
MKLKLATLIIISSVLLLISGCASSYTTVMSPATDEVLITTGDMPNKEYTTLGFVEASSTVLGVGLPTEEKISEMKSIGLNDGLVEKAKAIGADAVINVEYSTVTASAYLIFSQFNLSIKGTAIKYK